MTAFAPGGRLWTRRSGYSSYSLFLGLRPRRRNRRPCITFGSLWSCLLLGIVPHGHTTITAHHDPTLPIVRSKRLIPPTFFFSSLSLFLFPVCIYPFLITLQLPRTEFSSLLVGWLILDEIIQIKRVRNILRCNRRNVSRGGGTALFGLTESRKEPGRGVACKSFVVIKIHLSWLDIYESPSVSPLRRIGF